MTHLKSCAIWLYGRAEVGNHSGKLPASYRQVKIKMRKEMNTYGYREKILLAKAQRQLYAV